MAVTLHPTAGQETSEPVWVDLRDHRGKLRARIEVRTGRLVIKDGGEVVAWAIGTVLGQSENSLELLCGIRGTLGVPEYR